MEPISEESENQVERLVWRHLRRPTIRAGGKISTVSLVTAGTLLIWCAFSAIFLHIFTHPLEINHDSASLLYAGGLLAEGKRLYVDFTSTNPPLIFYLSALPAFLSRWLALPLIFVFSVMTALGVVASALASRRELRLGAPALGIWGGVAGGLSFLYALASLALMQSVFDHSFGQREHLFVLFYLPYFFLRLFRWEEPASPGVSEEGDPGRTSGRIAALLTGSAAGLGVCLKPHFLVIALVVEGVFLLRRRRLAPLFCVETASLAGVGFLYGVHFLLLPEYAREAIFDRWLPFIAGRYQAYDTPIRVLVHPASFFPFVLLTLVLGVACSRRRVGVSRLVLPLLIFEAASAASFLMQHKLWFYQLLPALFPALFILYLSFLEPEDEAQDKPGSSPRIGVIHLLQVAATFSFLLGIFERRGYAHSAWVAAGALFLTVVTTWTVRRMAVLGETAKGGIEARRHLRVAATTILVSMVMFLAVRPMAFTSASDSTSLSMLITRATETGDTLLFLATSTSAPFPLVLQIGRRLASRYFTVWPVPLLYQGVKADPEGRFPYRSALQMPEEERRFLSELGEDIRIHKPKLIFLWDGGPCQGCPDGFSLSGYFERAGFLAGPMRPYKYAGRLSGYKIYAARN